MKVSRRYSFIKPQVKIGYKEAYQKLPVVVKSALKIYDVQFQNLCDAVDQCGDEITEKLMQLSATLCRTVSRLQLCILRV